MVGAWRLELQSHGNSKYNNTHDNTTSGRIPKIEIVESPPVNIIHNYICCSERISFR